MASKQLNPASRFRQEAEAAAISWATPRMGHLPHVKRAR